MKAKYEVRYTFSSEVLLRKHRNASENSEPQEPVRKSAMQGHSRAFWAISSTDWKLQNFKFFHSFTRFPSWKAKYRSNANLSVLTSIFCSFCNNNNNIIKKTRHKLRFRFSHTFTQTREVREKWNMEKQPSIADFKEAGLEVSVVVVVWASAAASELSIWPILNPDFWVLNSEPLWFCGALKIQTQFWIGISSSARKLVFLLWCCTYINVIKRT